jgi:hypothetical protein
MRALLRDAFVTDEMLALRERNEQRAREAREAMGTRYVCHPDNQVRRKPANEPVFVVGAPVAAPEWLVDHIEAGERK